MTVEQYFLVLFSMLHKVFLIFESLQELHVTIHMEATEQYVLSYGVVRISV